MTSKERLEEIRKQLEKTCLKDCGHGSNENCICLNNQYANLEHLEKALDKLEKYENNMPQLIEGHEKLQSAENWGDIADSAFLIRTALEKMEVIKED